ncbi:MAG: energy-coupling factor ABC transporter ATP-binding protein [Actinobacteria bacterium]|nr:energy-coupling factor ABC transporter ATP-binding protein [Actinomycetota bacterium]
MENKIKIEISNLSFEYPSARKISSFDQSMKGFKEVLHEISFIVSEGEKVSLIGPNGAGKSTLLLNIAGLQESKNRKGMIKIGGTELNDKNIYGIREKIGFVFQDPNDQLFSTSVFDDVAFGLINYLNKKRDPRAKDIKFIERMVRESLTKVNLKNVESEMPYFLSFGEKKLAALATVLSYDPEILILDEPSSNLDPSNRDNFIELLKQFDKTIIAATHDLDLAYDFSKRAIVLNRGRIVFDGNAREVLKDKDFLSANNLALPLRFRKYNGSATTTITNQV